MERINNSKELLEILRNMVFKSCSVGLLQKKDIYGLSFQQRSALIYLSQTGPLKMVDLCRMLCVNKSALTRMVDSLEKKNLVKRNKVFGNRPGFNITLSRDGNNIVNKLDAEPLQILNRILTKNNVNEYNLYKKAFSLFLERLNEKYSS